MEDITIDKIEITEKSDNLDYDYVCQNLYEYNVKKTNGILKIPGKDINLYLKDESNHVVGGLFCETWNYGMNIDVFWIAEEYRKKGFGKIMLTEAERLGKEMGCTFAHTSTFTYQSPDFYISLGYEVFGV